MGFLLLPWIVHVEMAVGFERLLNHGSDDLAQPIRALREKLVGGDDRRLSFALLVMAEVLQ